MFNYHESVAISRLSHGPPRALALTICIMDAKVFARIAAALVSATAEAKVRSQEYGIDPEFRKIGRHSR